MYKILLLVYKCLHDSAPIYLQELIKKYQPTRNLRSSTQSRLTCSSTSTQYGRRSFSVAASELWNSFMPLHVKNSKTIILKDLFVHNGFLIFCYICSNVFCPGGGLLSPKSYVDVPTGPRKSDYLYTNFLPNFPPISIPFSKEKHPIWPNWVLFTIICPQIHPIYVIWAPSSPMKTPPIAIPNFAKKHPKGTYMYTMSMWEPPPPGSFDSLLFLFLCNSA